MRFIRCIGRYPRLIAGQEIFPPLPPIREDHSSNLKRIQHDISRRELKLNHVYLDNIATEISNLLSQETLNKESVSSIAKILRYVGKSLSYSQSFFDFISKHLLMTRSEEVLLGVIPSFIWACARVRYYSPTLLSSVGESLFDNLEKLSPLDVDMLMFSYAKLNHPLPGLVEKVEKWLLGRDEVLSQYRLPWTLAWAGMVLMQYPKQLLSLILTDEYIEDSSHYIEGFRLLLLFQLKISLNLECPELKLGRGWDTARDMKQWGICRSALKNVSNDLLRKSFLEKLELNQTLKRSVFGSNLNRALRMALDGGKCLQSDPLSLSGYNFDFEVLLDRGGVPIEIPHQWKYRSVKLLAASLGSCEEKRIRRHKMKIPDDLLSSMKEVEQNGDANTSSATAATITSTNSVHSLCNGGYHHQPSINVASDWGSRFVDLPRPVERRIIVEADGYHHYASNCDHVLGSTHLKRRHIQQLGWELVTVDYKVWRGFETGDSQAKYIHSQIYGQN